MLVNMPSPCPCVFISGCPGLGKHVKISIFILLGLLGRGAHSWKDGKKVRCKDIHGAVLKIRRSLPMYVICKVVV